MNFLNFIWNKLLIVLQFILVFTFIIFEEIIWEGLAKPIYLKIESFRILRKLELAIIKSNRYILLIFFTLFLLGVEGAGLIAGLFFVQGKVLLGALLYVAKIPIAGFTFWLFKVGQKKLLSFAWFAWAYGKIMAGFYWIKALSIYQNTLKKTAILKEKFKAMVTMIKLKYFSKEGRFVRELKSFYSYIKNIKSRKS